MCCGMTESLLTRPFTHFRWECVHNTMFTPFPWAECEHMCGPSVNTMYRPWRSSRSYGQGGRD